MLINATEARKISESYDYINFLCSEIEKAIIAAANKGEKEITLYRKMTKFGFEKLRPILESLGYKVKGQLSHCLCEVIKIEW